MPLLVDVFKGHEKHGLRLHPTATSSASKRIRPIISVAPTIASRFASAYVLATPGGDKSVICVANDTHPGQQYATKDLVVAQVPQQWSEDWLTGHASDYYSFVITALASGRV